MTKLLNLHAIRGANEVVEAKTWMSPQNLEQFLRKVYCPRRECDQTIVNLLCVEQMNEATKKCGKFKS